MLTNWELWAIANHYVKKHGDNAAIYAAMKADELMDEGELEGAKNFRAVVRRINALSDKPNSAVH